MALALVKLRPKHNTETTNHVKSCYCLVFYAEVWFQSWKKLELSSLFW